MRLTLPRRLVVTTTGGVACVFVVVDALKLRFGAKGHSETGREMVEI